MNGIGSGANGELTFLDIISLMSFFIGLMNLDENLTQGDKQELQHNLDVNAERMLNEIHSHLKEQDKKIDSILKKLEDK